MATGLDNLEIYQLACKLEKIVHQAVKTFPYDEKFSRGDQLKRSSSSVANNIAESYGRFGFQDKIQFLYQARGSVEEARSQILRSTDFIKKELIESLNQGYTILIKKINGFIGYLRQCKNKNHPTT
jgi:four helix bundle protein